MSKKSPVLRTALLAAMLLVSAGCGRQQADAAAQQIRDVLNATWQQASMPLELDPIVVEGSRAVVGWTQGPLGGRALLERGERGWEVVLCTGDMLRNQEGLISAGVPAAEAASLAKALRDAERKVSAARLAQMASFKGLMRMGSAHAMQVPAVATDADPRQSLQVRDAWSRATAPGAAAGVVYLHILNAGEPDQLVGVRSSVSDAAGLHETRTNAGVASMQATPVLNIPRNASIDLAPSGLHVMLTGLHHQLVQGERFPLTLQFREAGERQVEVTVAALGAAAAGQPEAGGHEHMHH